MGIYLYTVTCGYLRSLWVPFSAFSTQVCSQCLMTSGTTAWRLEFATAWLSSPWQRPPWWWTGDLTPCWSLNATELLTRRLPSQATPTKCSGKGHTTHMKHCSVVIFYSREPSCQMTGKTSWFAFWPRVKMWRWKLLPDLRVLFYSLPRQEKACFLHNWPRIWLICQVPWRINVPKNGK